MTESTDEIKKKKHRSPNFPAVNLEKAVELTGVLYEKYGKHSVPVNLVHKAWNYAEHGSAGNRVVAAVKAFGLIDVTGIGEQRKVTISDCAYRVCENAPDRPKILKTAALSPDIHATVWNHFNGTVPNDDLLKNYLLWEHEPNFNKQSVSDFISEFRDSISFAKVESTICEEDTCEEESEQSGRGTALEIGDLVNWESQGILQFKEPKRVVGFTVDKEWVYVEGSKTGLPVNDVQLVERKQKTVDPANTASIAVTPPPNPYYEAHKTSTDSCYDQQIPLLDGKMATIHMPRPMSEENFEYMLNFFRAIKPSIVTKQKRQVIEGPEHKNS